MARRDRVLRTRDNYLSNDSTSSPIVEFQIGKSDCL